MGVLAPGSAQPWPSTQPNVTQGEREKNTIYFHDSARKPLGHFLLSILLMNCLAIFMAISPLLASDVTKYGTNTMGTFSAPSFSWTVSLSPLPSPPCLPVMLPSMAHKLSHYLPLAKSWNFSLTENLVSLILRDGRRPQNIKSQISQQPNIRSSSTF